MACRLLSALFVLGALSLVTPPARAVNYTWVGTGPGDWRDGTKWSPNVGGYPGSGPGDSATIPNFAAGSATLRGAITLDSLIVQSGGFPISVTGNPVDGAASLTATTFTFNAGDLALTSTDGPANASITTGGGNFTNTGGIRLLAGAGGQRAFNALNILNDGVIFVGVDGRVGQGLLQNGTGSVGQVLVAAGATLTTHQYLQQGANTSTRISGALDVETGPVQFAGGHLTGDGTINDSVTLTSTAVEPRGPGPTYTQPGTLRLLDDVTFGNNARLDVLLGAPGEASRLAVDGDLALTGSGTVLTLAGGAANTTYVVASYAGTLTGTFSVFTPGYTVDYSTPGEIRVTVAPEPHALAFVGVALAVCRRRRGRRF